MNGSVIFLGLAEKAGKLEIGEESCAAAVRSRKAKAVLVASDAGQNSVSGAAALASSCGAARISLPFTKAELGSVLGRGTPGMLALTDIGMASSFAKKLDAEFPGRFAAEAKALEGSAAGAAEYRIGARKNSLAAGKRKNMKRSAR